MSELWHPSADALVTELEHELVLLHALSGEMFSLNATGQAVWQALPATLEQAATCLEGLGATPAAAQSDAQALLEALGKVGLIVGNTADGGGLGT